MMTMMKMMTMDTDDKDDNVNTPVIYAPSVHLHHRITPHRIVIRNHILCPRRPPLTTQRVPIHRTAERTVVHRCTGWRGDLWGGGRGCCLTGGGGGEGGGRVEGFVERGVHRRAVQRGRCAQRGARCARCCKCIQGCRLVHRRRHLWLCPIGRFTLHPRLQFAFQIVGFGRMGFCGGDNRRVRRLVFLFDRVVHRVVHMVFRRRWVIG